METYENFINDRKNILKSIFNGKSVEWIENNINYQYFNKSNILTPYKFKGILNILNEKKINDKEISWILFLIEYAYIPIPIIKNYFDNVILTSDNLEQRGLVKYYIFKQFNNIYITFRGTKTLWETINTLKFYRVKFNLLETDDKKDFIDWRNKLIKNNKFNSSRIPLKDDDEIEIHKGFLDEANLIYGDVIEKISLALEPSCKKTHIFLCGHSLGGVLANIIGIYIGHYLKQAVRQNRLEISIATANTPPIGNKNFNLLIPYLQIRNYIRIYNYQDFIPYYGYYGTWIEGKKFRHLDFILKNGVDGSENSEGRFLEDSIGNTKVWVKDYGKNLDIFLKKIQLEKETVKLNTKYIFHDFFCINNKNKAIFI